MSDLEQRLKKALRESDHADRKRGRPNVLGESIALDVRLPTYLWASLSAEAEEKHASMAETARAILAAHFEGKKR